jgi:hypothetical protein
MKYTFLPPQPAPPQLTAYRRPVSLGEHQAAFLNATNRYGFQVDEIPDEPIVDEMAALFLTVLYNLPKLSRVERQQEMAKHHRKMLSAGYEMQGGVYVRVKTFTEEEYEQARRDKRRVVKVSQAQQMLVRATPLQELEATKRDPRWQQPWNHAAYHEGIRKHIYATRTHFSYQAVTPEKLYDEKHRSRLDKLIDEMEQESNIKNSTLRRLVAIEKAGRMLSDQLSQFTTTINIEEFLDQPLIPKSDPSGHRRINPYLDN